jgi:integrase/recombinase XerD
VKVHLYIRVRLSDGNRQYVDPVYAANGKLKPLYAVVDGKPEHHPEGVYHLRLAYPCGLNCGGCHNRKGQCCANKAMCHHWGLHRFRKTFATMHHEAGVSVRTIQRWLQHSSLDTTLRYLAGSDDRNEKTRTPVNSTFAGFYSQQEVAQA